MIPSPVRLYAADASELADTTLYAAAYAAASGQRRQKTDRLLFEKDRRLSLAAELLLRFGLSEAGVKPDTLEFGYGEHGKPYLSSFPEIQFNLSHSGTRAVCAISPAAVGCDIERITEPAAAVAGKVFSKSEYDAVFGQESFDAQKEMFFRIWTRKESFVKATGLGVFKSLEIFEAAKDNPDETAAADSNQSPVLTDPEGHRWFFREYRFDKEYACSVCSAQDFFDEEVHEVRLGDVLNFFS